jgi:peptidylprolyl isomerase
MTQARKGNTVKVHYKGRLDDGTVFANSAEREVLEFTIGEDQILQGFEQAVVGMSPGELKTITVPADQAYGPRDEEMVLVVDRSRIPAHLKPKIGQQLEVRQADGEGLVVTVTDVSEASVTLDANHPLAGEDLIFDIQLVEIL